MMATSSGALSPTFWYVHCVLQTNVKSFHCNAHPNNAVILPHALCTTHQLLSALDFDLAFETSQSFLSADQIEETKALEAQSMRAALTTPEVNSGSLGQVSLPSAYIGLQMALRETLALAFSQTYMGEKCPEMSQDELEAFGGLVMMALEKTETCIA